MTKDEKFALVKELANGRDAQSLPLSKGTVLTFPKGEMEPKKEDGINGGNPWGSFTSKEGYRVSFTQLARRMNGIEYKAGNTVEARIEELLSANEAKDIVLKIKERIVLESTSREGKNSYLVFEPYTVTDAA